MEQHNEGNRMDPTYHIHNILRMFTDLSNKLEEDVKEVQDPQFAAMIETSREVVNGLKTAFEHYKGQSEEAFKK
jgi:predicted house-cleaning noncanonical NTP pyrophosphatase (MazG superfamily)